MFVVAPNQEESDDCRCERQPSERSRNAIEGVAQQNPPVPNATAHAIPPSALKSRNCNGGKRLTPASTAANTRSTATKRPRKTILPPCRRKRYSPRSSFRWSKPNKCPHLSNALRPSLSPSQ